MSRYLVTTSARRDLIGIWEWIAEDNADAADRVLEDLFTACERLADFPLIGHRSDEFGENVRVWAVHSYLIAYLPETQPLQIVRVVSGYRDLYSLLVGKGNPGEG